MSLLAESVSGYLENASWIRRMFEAGGQLKARYGAENVYDFSLGNPDLPAPAAVGEGLRRFAEHAGEPFAFGYMPNAGFPWAREQLAAHLSKEQGVALEANDVLLTCGAAGGLNAFLRANGGGDISVIAKIENQPGIDNIEDIFTECTGIMIARGDMGVEVPYEELPSIQKELIGKCRLLGKRVITATEMLESMTHNIRPTRAEIADVANAVYDGTSAIMLSGETAAGEHPVEALSAMARIAEYTEAHINYAKRFPKTQFEIHDTLDAISHATCGMAIDIGAKVITVCSITGRTARLISRFRGPTDIIGLTTNERAYRKLALSWGITPVMSEVYESTDVLFYHALKVSRAVMQLEKGDKVIITGGIINGRSGNTNTIKVEYA